LDLVIQRLNDLIRDEDRNELRILLNSFKCSAEPASEHYLKNIAIKHEENDISRTYLFLDRKDLGAYIIRGFFTLAVKCLSVDEHHLMSDRTRQQMNIDRGVAQAYLLGQLAKADGAEKGFGREMMEHAFELFQGGNEMFGCRVVRLDCRDALMHYYESFGFVFIGKNRKSDLNQMIAII